MMAFPSLEYDATNTTQRQSIDTMILVCCNETSLVREHECERVNSGRDDDDDINNSQETILKSAYYKQTRKWSVLLTR